MNIGAVGSMDPSAMRERMQAMRSKMDSVESSIQENGSYKIDSQASGKFAKILAEIDSDSNGEISEAEFSEHKTHREDMKGRMMEKMSSMGGMQAMGGAGKSGDMDVLDILFGDQEDQTNSTYGANSLYNSTSYNNLLSLVA